MFLWLLYVFLRFLMPNTWGYVEGAKNPGQGGAQNPGLHGTGRIDGTGGMTLRRNQSQTGRDGLTFGGRVLGDD